MAETGMLLRRKVWISLAVVLVLALVGVFAIQARDAEREIRAAEAAAGEVAADPASDSLLN